MTPRMLTPAVWRDITAGSSEVFFIWQSKARVKTTTIFWIWDFQYLIQKSAAPYYNDFIDALTDGSNEPGVKGQLMEAMTNYTNSLERILDILDEFYQENQLESNKLI